MSAKWRIKGKKKVKAVYRAVNETPSESYTGRTSLATWDHTVLPVTRHKWNFVYFCKSDVSVVQGHLRSLTLVPIESAYATSY